VSLCVHEGQWSASRFGRLTLGIRTAGTHSTGGWVDPTAGMDALVTVQIVDGHPSASPSTPPPPPRTTSVMSNAVRYIAHATDNIDNVQNTTGKVNVTNVDRILLSNSATAASLHDMIQ
jgi:hypothetical protein